MTPGGRCRAHAAAPAPPGPAAWGAVAAVAALLVIGLGLTGSHHGGIIGALLAAMLLGLPHGWGRALSWSDIRLRTTWIAAVVTPSALGAYAVTLPVVRSRTGDPRRGGRHR
ncbi:hypothetical protein OG937_03775 [Streptomyces sp. NBC_00510]